jgi:hypothetical protein
MTENNNTERLAVDDVADELGVTMTPEQRQYWSAKEVEFKVQARVLEKQKAEGRAAKEMRDMTLMNDAEYAKYISRWGC